jgi:hypothetical protein
MEAPETPDERESSSTREQKPRRREAMKALDDIFARTRIRYDQVVIRLNWERIALAISLAVIVLLLADRALILRDAASSQQVAGSNVAAAKATPRARSVASAPANLAIQAADVQPAESAPIEVETEVARRPMPPLEPMDLEDIVALRIQGLQLLANGDFIAGRMALQRAAQAGDVPARAALADADAASEQAMDEQALGLTKKSAAAR